MNRNEKIVRKKAEEYKKKLKQESFNLSSLKEEIHRVQQQMKYDEKDSISNEEKIDMFPIATQQKILDSYYEKQFQKEKQQIQPRSLIFKLEGGDNHNRKQL